MDLPINDEDDPPPTKEDCCNSGCSPCVFDIYEKRMAEKKNKKGRKEEDKCRYDLLSQTTFKPFILLEKLDFGGCYSRLTFQPFVPKTVIVENNSENISLETGSSFDNTKLRTEKKDFEVNLKENEGSDCIISENNVKLKNNLISGVQEEKLEFEISEECMVTNSMISEKDSKNSVRFKNNIVSGVEKGLENKISDNTTSEDITTIFNVNDNNLKQEINGYLPYKPGQHLTMKSWRMEIINEQKRIGELNRVTFKEVSKVQSIIDEEPLSIDIISKEEGLTSTDLRFQEQSNLIDISSTQNLMGEEGILGTETNNFTTRDYEPIELTENRSSVTTNLETNQEISGNKPTNSINIDQNLLKNSVTKQALMGRDNELSESNHNQSLNTTNLETNQEILGDKATNFDQNIPKNSFTKQAIMGRNNEPSESAHNQSFTITNLEETQEISGNKSTNIINIDQNLPKNSLTKQAIMGIEKPNFITRDYTPITLTKNSTNCCFQIIIKYYDNGLMSQYLKSLKAGDKVLFRGPYGDFVYHNNHIHLLGICMGTGIAPIFTIFREILDDEGDETFLKLLFGCKDSESILLRDKLGEMAKFWNFGAEFFLTSGSLDGAKFGENFREGRITKNCVFQNLKPNQLVLVCGSDNFNSEIVGYLNEFEKWGVEYFVF